MCNRGSKLLNYTQTPFHWIQQCRGIYLAVNTPICPYCSKHATARDWNKLLNLYSTTSIDDSTQFQKQLTTGISQKSRLILLISLISFWYLRYPAGGRSKKLGAFVKSKRCDNSGVAPLKEGGFLHSDPKAKANYLEPPIYIGLFNWQRHTTSWSRWQPPSSHGKHHCEWEWSHQAVEKSYAIHSLWPWWDTMLLKQTAVEIAPAVTLLFQNSLDQGKVPSQWKKANVVPLFKKGSWSEAANYRSISLTSVLCKLWEHIIHRAVMQHLTNNNILSDTQQGCRKHSSCETQLICMMDDLAKGLDNKSQIDVVLLDYEKAFDKVSHWHLLKKTEHYGIHL